MNPCIDQPISWLRLERYELGELCEPEGTTISAHLAECVACRACASRITNGEQTLRLPLTAAAPQPGPRRALRCCCTAHGWFALASAAATIALLLQRAPASRGVPPARTQLKGGELALELVRMDPAGQLLEPDRFADEDRFKVLLTCPPLFQGHADVLIFQAESSLAPLPSQRVESCGNRRSLDGAFRLTGTQPVTVCVVFSASAPVDRATLPGRADELPPESVCRTLRSLIPKR